MEDDEICRATAVFTEERFLRYNRELDEAMERRAFRGCVLRSKGWIRSRSRAPEGYESDLYRSSSSTELERYEKDYPTDLSLWFSPEAESWSVQAAHEVPILEKCHTDCGKDRSIDDAFFIKSAPKRITSFKVWQDVKLRELVSLSDHLQNRAKAVLITTKRNLYAKIVAERESTRRRNLEKRKEYLQLIQKPFSFCKNT